MGAPLFCNQTGCPRQGQGSTNKQPLAIFRFCVRVTSQSSLSRTGAYDFQLGVQFIEPSPLDFVAPSFLPTRPFEIVCSVGCRSFSSPHFFYHIPWTLKIFAVRRQLQVQHSDLVLEYGARRTRNISRHIKFQDRLFHVSQFH